MSSSSVVELLVGGFWSDLPAGVCSMRALCKIPWTGWLTQGTGGWTFGGKGVGVGRSSDDCGSEGISVFTTSSSCALTSLLFVA